MTELARRTDRSSSFSETMAAMIATALRIVGERNGRLPSIAVLAHAMKMNRTTAYYYFQSPEVLLTAIKVWTFEQLVECLALPELNPDCMGQLVSFVLENPFAIGFLMDDLASIVSEKTIQSRWSELVDAMRRALQHAYPDAIVDAEVHIAWVLAGALSGPRLLQQVSKQDASLARIVERFRAEERRLIPCGVLA